MKNYVLAAAAAAAVSLIASAASAQDWSGAYVGAQVGYAWGDGEQPYGNVGGPFNSSQDDVNLDGFVFGGRAGYDWQTTNWVFGVVADGSSSRRPGTAP